MLFESDKLDIFVEIRSSMTKIMDFCDFPPLWIVAHGFCERTSIWHFLCNFIFFCNSLCLLYTNKYMQWEIVSPTLYFMHCSTRPLPPPNIYQFPKVLFRLNIISYQIFHRKWNWPNIVLKYFLKKIIRTKTGGQRYSFCQIFNFHVP